MDAVGKALERVAHCVKRKTLVWKTLKSVVQTVLRSVSRKVLAPNGAYPKAASVDATRTYAKSK